MCRSMGLPFSFSDPSAIHEQEYETVAAVDPATMPASWSVGKADAVFGELHADMPTRPVPERQLELEAAAVAAAAAAEDEDDEEVFAEEGDGRWGGRHVNYGYGEEDDVVRPLVADFMNSLLPHRLTVHELSSMKHMLNSRLSHRVEEMLKQAELTQAPATERISSAVCVGGGDDDEEEEGEVGEEEDGECDAAADDVPPEAGKCSTGSVQGQQWQVPGGPVGAVGDWGRAQLSELDRDPNGDGGGTVLI